MNSTLLKEPQVSVAPKKAYSLSIITRFSVLFFLSFFLFLLVRTFIVHFFALQIVAYSIITTPILYLLTRKNKTVVQLYDQSIEIKKYQNTWMAKHFIEITFLEQLYNVLLSLFNLNSFMEIPYADIIQVNSQTGDIEYYTTYKSMDEIFQGLNTLFIERNIENNAPKEKVQTQSKILLKYLAHEDELLDLLKQQNIQVI